MLLLHSDPAVRESLAETLRSAGIPLTVAGRIAEVERWPAGELVVTDERMYTPFWLSVGAIHVVVLTEGTAAPHLRHESVTSVPATMTREELLATVDSFDLVAA